MDMSPAIVPDPRQSMQTRMATDEDPPFKEWEQLNEKLKQIKKARNRCEATADDAKKAQEEYDRARARIDNR
jgi:hypothetical protein